MPKARAPWKVQPDPETAAALLSEVIHLFRWYARRCVERHGWEPRELVQDCVLTFLKNLPHFDGDPDHLPQYAHWSFLNVFRVWRRDRERAHARFPDAGLDRERGAGFEAVDSGPGPDERAEHAEALALLPGLLARLPADRREILAARFGLGGRRPLKLREMAGGKTREAARQRVESALAELREYATAAGIV